MARGNCKRWSSRYDNECCVPRGRETISCGSQLASLLDAKWPPNYRSKVTTFCPVSETSLASLTGHQALADRSTCLVVSRPVCEFHSVCSTLRVGSASAVCLRRRFFTLYLSRVNHKKTTVLFCAVYVHTYFARNQPRHTLFFWFLACGARLAYAPVFCCCSISVRIVHVVYNMYMVYTVRAVPCSECIHSKVASPPVVDTLSCLGCCGRGASAPVQNDQKVDIVVEFSLK